MVADSVPVVAVVPVVGNVYRLLVCGKQVEWASNTGVRFYCVTVGGNCVSLRHMNSGGWYEEKNQYRHSETKVKGLMVEPIE